MVIEIIGARASNPIGSNIIRKHASIKFQSQGKVLQIEIGNSFEPPADYLLFTHLHDDHAGKLDTLPSHIPIYAPAKSFQKFIQDKQKSAIYFKPEILHSIEPFKILAFPVRHSRHTRAFGYRVEAEGKAFVWLPDFRRLLGVLRYLKNLDILFIGASCWKRHITHRNHENYGHMAILTTLKTLKQNHIRPKQIILIHLGKQLMPIEEKIALLRQKFPDFSIDYGFDGEKITIY